MIAPKIAPMIAATIALGCGAPAPLTIPHNPPVGDLMHPCSRLHQDLVHLQGPSADTECGADITGLQELVPFGNHQLLVRRRFASANSLWEISADGIFSSGSALVPQFDASRSNAYTLLPGPTPRVLVTDPRLSRWTVYTVPAVPAPNVLVSPYSGDWPTTGWKGPGSEPWGHEFIGLGSDQILDRDLGDGSTRVWQLGAGPDGAATLTLRDDLAGPARAAFTRGHRLVLLDPGRLLEWLPRPCADDSAATAVTCVGADFNIWRFTLDPDGSGTPRDPFDPTTVVPGSWGDVGAGQNILSDGDHLIVWTRATGELRSYPLDPTTDDPLASMPLDATPPQDELRSRDWTPPTRSPAIRHLVLILQDGRSFDSYFGNYCRGAATADGTPLARDDGPDGCEAIPSMIAGAPAGCAAPDPATDQHHPRTSSACLRAKINGGVMDGFAAPASGDPLDVACAGVGADAGAVAAYQQLAAGGALADRYFQTFAYLDDGAPPSPTACADTPDDSDFVGVENLLYIESTRFAAVPALLPLSPLLSIELGRLQVPWAIYAGKNNLARIIAFGVPDYYDPAWYPYRSLESGELERDIATMQLPSIALVIGDAANPEYGEGPGHPFDKGIQYVTDLVSRIEASPYAGDTLVLLTYMTAGGYYDHVAPLASPLSVVDAADTAAAPAVAYGPRVPLLALGPLARRNRISHVALEISSLTVFIEWNWLDGVTIKRGASPSDTRQYRDTTVFNIGSLLDVAATGEPHVPEHRDD